ncbi:MAG: oligosaccharide flippase family protein [Oceanospirillaceae bacterium]|nr:oligosaccharide flippase family protein [Oceanospirillaceae bacterium]
MSVVNSENRTFLVNASFLALIQAANLFLPLLTFPYLIRVLGVELFGILALATAVMHYVNVIIDYGFNLTATRDVARIRNDKAALSQLFSTVQFIKINLVILCAFCLVIVHLFTSFLGSYSTLYWLTFFSVVANGLFPIWLFQGMEKMRVVSILMVISKLFFTIFIFFLVDSRQDYLIVPLLNVVGSSLTFIIGLFLAVKLFDLHWYTPITSRVISQLGGSWYVFLSQLKITLFSNTNVVILGFFSGPLAVGYYVSAEKIMRALALLQTPITQALYPQISQTIRVSPDEAIFRLRHIAFYGVWSYGVLLMTVFIMADWGCVLLFGSEGEYIAELLRIMLPIPLFIFLNNIFGTQIMLNLGRDRAFFRALLSIALISLVLCLALSFSYQAYGAALALLMSELALVSTFAFLARDIFFSKTSLL